MTSLLPRSSWLLYPSQINSRKAQQMTALQSSVLSQMTIPQLKVLCSFTSQWRWHSNEASKRFPSFSWLMCLFPMKMIHAVYSKWLRTGTTLSSSQPLSMMALSSWLSSQYRYWFLREHNLLQPLSKHSSWLLDLRKNQLIGPSWLSGAVIPKYPFTSAKIAEYFVRE